MLQSCITAPSTVPNPSLEETWENKCNLQQLVSKHGPGQTSLASIPVCSHNERELALLLPLTERMEQKCCRASSRHKTLKRQTASAFVLWGAPTM